MAPNEQQATRERTTSEWARLVGSLALAALAIAFAVLNLDEVSVNWIFGTWSTPLIVVIVLCLLVGALIDRLVLRPRRRR
jgi:lipopolysaccharide assembly protein A